MTAFTTEGFRGLNSAIIADTLRKDIISLELAPGTILSRSELQERFKVSSSPIRDALIRLQEQNLVEIFPQHRTMVSPINVPRAHRAQFLRRSIELELVRELAEHGNQTVVEQLRSCVSRQVSLADANQHEAFARSDMEFHQLMYEALGVSELWNVVTRQSGDIERIRRMNLPSPGRFPEIIEDHRRLIRAIETMSPLDGRDVLIAHFSRAFVFLEKWRKRHPQYFSD